MFLMNMNLTARKLTEKEERNRFCMLETYEIQE